MDSNSVTVQAVNAAAEKQLVLSVFGGFDLLAKGFEKAGFCVVGGVDILFDKDIRDFHAVAGRFDGVIGGSPCQDFSKARRTAPTGKGLEMIEHFKRIVLESDCSWFLLENVPTVPSVTVLGYTIQSFALNPRDLGFSQNRPRHFQFGSKDNRILGFDRMKKSDSFDACVTATEGLRSNRRSFEDVCKLQGLEKVPNLQRFSTALRYSLVGNGVHLGVAEHIALKILGSGKVSSESSVTFCSCGCGEILTGRKSFHSSTCRKRLFDNRKREMILT